MKNFNNLADAMSHYKKQNRKEIKRRSAQYKQAKKMSVLREAQVLYQSLYDATKKQLKEAENHDKKILIEELNVIDIQLGIVECQIMLFTNDK